MRVAKRDEGVDPIRTRLWFLGLSNRFGELSPRQVQRLVNPEALRESDYGSMVLNNKFKAYATGKTVPSPKLVAKVEQQVRRSSWVLNHVLWKVLRAKESIAKDAKQWICELRSVSHIVLSLEDEVCLRGDRHMLPALERRASIDALAALTIVFKLNLEAGDSEQAWNVALSIHKVLMLMSGELLATDTAQPLYDLYAERIFSQVTYDGMAFDLEANHFEVVMALFHLLTSKAQKELANPRDRRMPTYYGLLILEGRYSSGMHEEFQPRTKRIAPGSTEDEE